jgi:hypothetical protein
VRNIIATFTVVPNGLASAIPLANAWICIELFGFAFRSDGVIIVSESL